MKTNERVGSLLRVCALLAGLFALGAGCGGTANSPGPALGSESHFLALCDGDCGGGFDCIGGICTRSCLTTVASCGDLGDIVQCTNASVEPGDVAVCDANCADANDCAGLGVGYRCAAGFCRYVAPVGVAGSACACNVASGQLCAAAPAAAPQTLSTTATPWVASVSYLPESAVIDDSGVYWYDVTGSVFGVRRGESEPVPLRQGESVGAANGALIRVLIGMAADQDLLYVGEASFNSSVTDTFPAPDYEPPGRLVSIPKDGTAPVVLLELEDATITPIAADAEHIIVLISGEQSGYYQVDRANLQLTRFPFRAPLGSSRWLGTRFYWTDTEYPPNLFRAGFYDTEPEYVTTVVNYDFAVGPGYVLFRQDRIVDPREPLQSPIVVVYDEATGCGRALPDVGEAISVLRALDAEHVYWYSYQEFGPGTPLESNDPDLKLYRVDIDSGALERLDTPGFSPGAGASIVGQNAENVYVTSEIGLVAIRKP